MERIQYASYDLLVGADSSLVKLYPNINFKSFRTFLYLQNMAQVFGFIFYLFFSILFSTHGKTFMKYEFSFRSIILFQILTFGIKLVASKASFTVNGVEYFAYDTFLTFPSSLVNFCNRIATAQTPLYWLLLTAYLIIQTMEFTNQNIKNLKFAHIVCIPIAVLIILISFYSPEHMEVVMIVVCFVIYWIYRKHMVARLYSQEMSRKDISNLRRLHIWLSSQIFVALTYHLVKSAITMAIKSSVMDMGRQIYFLFWKDQFFQVLVCLNTYLNAILFAWSTINFIKSSHNSSAEQSALPVFVGGCVPIESTSRRPSTISVFSLNNVAPLTPRDPNMLHI